MKTLKLTIRTPEKDIFKGEILKITLDTELGRMQVYPGHTTLTAAIGFSPIKLVDKNKVEEDFVAKRGIILVSNRHKRVDILVMECFKTTELVPTTAKKYLQFIEEQLEKKADLKDFHIKFLEEEKFIVEKEIAHYRNGK